MSSEGQTINSAQSMICAIREIGIIPFFRSGVSGWSIEDLTPPEWWFYSSEELGPWDWKIEVVREGDIAYGKFLSGKAAFATVEWYRHLMNWRRSLPQWQLAAVSRGKTIAGCSARNGSRQSAAARPSDKAPMPASAGSGVSMLHRYLCPIALGVIRENGSIESSALRAICGERVTPYQLRQLGAKYRKLLRPALKKNVMDSVLQCLDMGTWTVIGDFRRVYRGPNLDYTGWQRSSITTPDALFGNPDAVEPTPAQGSPAAVNHSEPMPAADIHKNADPSSVPFWAKFTGGEDDNPIRLTCTPEESRQLLLDHLSSLFPADRDKFAKII